MKKSKLKERFNKVVDDYARCLCKSFGYKFEDCFFVSDDRTDCFALSDSGYFITLSDLITIVENNVDYDTYTEYDYYNRCMFYGQLNHPDKKDLFNHINLISWIKNCPKRYTKEELEKEEELYWK